MQLICSPSGIGKTSIAMEVFKKHGILPPKPEGLKPSQRLLISTRDRPMRSRWSASCFNCASQAAVLLLDDPGPIAHNEDGLDVLKTGFSAQRTVMLDNSADHLQRALPAGGHGSYNPLIPPPRFSTGDLRFLWHSPNPMSQRISLRNRRTSRSPNRPQRRSSPNWWYPRQRASR